MGFDWIRTKKENGIFIGHILRKPDSEIVKDELKLELAARSGGKIWKSHVPTGNKN